MKKKVRKIRGTKGGNFPKGEVCAVPISTLRTEQACSRLLTYLERHERRAFNRAMREVKPQVEDWLRYIIHTKGKDSADAKMIREYWANMVARYKQYRQIESYYEGKKPVFDPDVNGTVYG